MEHSETSALVNVQGRKGEKRKFGRKHCSHCDTFVGHTTFYAHKEKYFVNGKWNKNDSNILKCANSCTD